METFKQEMDRVIRESQRMENVDQIWLPGEMEYYRVRERLEKGIPLAPAAVHELKRLAGSLNLSDLLE